MRIYFLQRVLEKMFLISRHLTM